MSYLDDREREIAKAHERRMASRSRFIESNPNAVSPQERAGVMQWQHNQGLTGRERALQQHEMDMLKQRGAIDLGVAEQKRLGMREQGSDAATVTANAAINGNRSRFGFFDNDGTYHPGSDVQSAEAKGLTDFEKNLLTNQTRLDIANSNNTTKREIAAGNNETKRDIATENNETKRALEEQKRVVAAEKEKDRLKLQYDKLEQKDRASVDTAANSLAREKGISFEDARTQVMASREQAQQQGGDTMTDQQGVKWQIVRDANGKPIGKKRVQ